MKEEGHRNKGALRRLRRMKKARQGLGTRITIIPMAKGHKDVNSCSKEEVKPKI